MINSTAFIGDIHGNVDAVKLLVEELRAREVERLVFLGDYINKGSAGPEVLDFLIHLTQEIPTTCLRGNHEEALLGALVTGDLRPMLRMAGAPTIRAYVGGPVPQDVSAALIDAVPDDHVRFLENMGNDIEEEDFVACHYPSRPSRKFTISAHVNVGAAPLITANSASIDTGCGSTGGVLTGLLWPSKHWVQADSGGVLRGAV